LVRRKTDKPGAAAPSTAACPPVTLDDVFQLLKAIQEKGESMALNLDGLRNGITALQERVQSLTDQVQQMQRTAAENEQLQGQVDELQQLLDQANQQLGDLLGGGGQPTSPAAPQAGGGGGQPTSPAAAPRANQPAGRATSPAAPQAGGGGGQPTSVPRQVGGRPVSGY
jgi:TolA-binding protein